MNICSICKKPMCDGDICKHCKAQMKAFKKILNNYVLHRGYTKDWRNKNNGYICDVNINAIVNNIMYEIYNPIYKD